jgi:hypothetical protein
MLHAKNATFLSFPYVCPEPVLAKCSFLYINGSKRCDCNRPGYNWRMLTLISVVPNVIMGVVCMLCVDGPYENRFESRFAALMSCEQQSFAQTGSGQQ